MKFFTIFFLNFIVALNVSAAQSHIIIFPESVSEAQVEVLSENVRIILMRLKQGDSLKVFGGKGFDLIAKTKLPEDDAFKDRSMREEYFEKYFSYKIDDYLSSHKSSSTSADKLFLPKALRRISVNDYKDSKVYVFASPFVPDGEGYLPFTLGFPSQAYLFASANESIFTTTEWDAAKNLNFLITYIYPKSTEWVRDFHRQKIIQFYSSFVKLLGSRMCHMSADESLLSSSSCSIVEPNIEIDAKQKLKFNIIQTASTNVDWIFQNSTEIVAPQEKIGQLELGIRWPENIDLDLYATYEGTEISFKNPAPSNSVGILVKDIQTSPASTNGYETIIFNKPVDITKLKIAVNYFEGSGSGAFTLRAKFNNKVYSYNGMLKATKGNRGAGERNQPHWQIIDPTSLFKLN